MKNELYLIPRDKIIPRMKNERFAVTQGGQGMLFICKFINRLISLRVRHDIVYCNLQDLSQPQHL